MADTALDDSNACLEPCGKEERWQIRRWVTPMSAWSHDSNARPQAVSSSKALKRCLSQS